MHPPSPPGSMNEPTGAKLKTTKIVPSTRQTHQTATVTVTTTTTALTKEDVHNAINRRRYLEKCLLLCPAGEPIMTTSLSTCLHQISEMGGVGKLVGNAIRAATYLAEEIEENAISKVVREVVLAQVNELALDMRALVDDAKTKIDEHAQMRKDEMERPSAPATTPLDLNQATQALQAHCLYADTLINPPPHADPKLAAREGIQARQIMLEGIDQNSAIGKMDGSQLKAELNKIIGEIGWKGKGIWSAILQKNKGVLIELETDNAFRWINKKDNKFQFSVEVGPDVIFKPQSHTIIAFNVPLTIDPENEAHRKEICDANHLEKEAIASICWVKPVAQRSPEQKSAHLFISFTDPFSANRALANGFNICNKKIRMEKVKKEPTRCLKCQGWNHHTYKCISQVDRCRKSPHQPMPQPPCSTLCLVRHGQPRKLEQDLPSLRQEGSRLQLSESGEHASILPDPRTLDLDDSPCQQTQKIPQTRHIQTPL